MTTSYSRRSLVALTFALVGVLAITLSIKQGFDYGMTADSAIYLLMASSLSPYAASSEASLFPFLFENYPFPPLFPAVLALFGGGHEAALISYLLNAAIFLLAMWFYYLWSKSVLDSTTGALSLVVLMALMPNTISQLLVVQSEHLYLLLLLAGFWMQQQTYSTHYDYTAGLMFALAALTRTIGVLAVMVYLARYWFSRRWGGRILTLILVLAPIVTWLAYRRVYHGGHGYTSIMLSGIEGQVIENLLGQVAVNIQLMALYWVRCFDSGIATHSGYVIAVATVIMVIGFAARLYRLHADALYVLLYTLVLLVWPYPAQFERFFYVLMPFALAYGMYAIQFLKSLVSRKMLGMYTAAYIVLIVLTMLPTLLGMSYQFLYRDAVKGDQVRTTSWLQSRDRQSTISSQQFMGRVYHFMRDIALQVPEGECVLSTVPAYFMLHTGRMSMKPVHATASDAMFDQNTKRCRYVFMLAATPKPSVGNPPMYPFHRISDRMEVLGVIYTEPGDSNSNVAAMLARI